MKEQLKKLHDANAWTRCPKSQASGAKILQGRWVFHLNFNNKGFVTLFRAIWVIYGNREAQGVDFYQSYAPFASDLSRKILYAHAVEKNWKARHLDVVTMYLNAKIFNSGLLKPQGDGPFAFANAFGATFRVVTFDITHTGDLAGYFIQGSQRWQSIKLISGKTLVNKRARFISSVDQSPLSTMPGYFASSNSTYSDIWALGPRTQQLVCFPPQTQTSTWDITSLGAYIRGQKPATTAKVVNLSNYTLSFDTMIDHGGTGWRVDTEIEAIQATGLIFILTSE